MGTWDGIAERETDCMAKAGRFEQQNLFSEAGMGEVGRN